VSKHSPSRYKPILNKIEGEDNAAAWTLWAEIGFDPIRDMSWEHNYRVLAELAREIHSEHAKSIGKVNSELSEL
jgi:hypothetical protein